MIYDKLAAYYDEFVDQNLNKLYLELITKRFTEGTIVDLGCGTGPLAIMLAKNNFFVTATDISDQMLEVAYNNSANEGLNINFFVHNILDPLNIDCDIITMSSDVINYLDNENDVEKAFRNIKEVMNSNSVFIFDYLKLSYLNSLIGHQEEIKMGESTLIWEVNSTSKTAQISHKVTIDGEEETHTQTTFAEDQYDKLLNNAKMETIEKIILDDRIVLVCKKI